MLNFDLKEYNQKICLQNQSGWLLSSTLQPRCTRFESHSDTRLKQCVQRLCNYTTCFPKFLNIMKSDNTRGEATTLLKFQDMFRPGTQTTIS